MPFGRISHSPLGLASLAPTLALILGLVAPAETRAEEFLPIDEFIGEDGRTGDALYEQILANRFDAYEQIFSMRSSAPGGSFQTVRLRLRYRHYGDESRQIVSKTIAKYFEPQDVRHLGYLVINKRTGRDDQFVYRPSARKVRRVNVRGEAIAGTDFSFEDIVPPEFGDGTHHRMADDSIDGLPVYVVTVVPLPRSESEYSKLVLYVEQEHFVPIHTLYWDNKRVLVKRLVAESDSITRFQARQKGERKDVYVAIRARMTHLKRDSFTEFTIEELDANPDLRDRHFSERELTASR